MFQKKPATPQEIEQQEKEKKQRLQELKEKEEREKHFQAVGLTVFEKLEEFLEKKKLKELEPHFITETITISEYNFETRGLPYSALIVSTGDDNKTVKVEYNALSYELVLKQGYNQVNFIDGMRINSTIPLTVALVRSTHPQVKA